MANGWSTKRVLITVRTYPVPAHRGIEVSCTAGVTSDGNWIRLFPIPYRFLNPDQRFTKYQWIEVDATRARGDARLESYTLRIDTIRRGEFIGPAQQWRARKDLILPLRRSSLCEIANDRRAGGSTLGIFRPASITRLVITPAKPPHWTPQEENLLRQQLLGFETTPRTPLEKIPLEFRYQFRCAATTCSGHRIMCTDWEMGQSYRDWRRKYGDRWEAMFRQRYEREMIEKNDTHFFVGNIHQHPDNWLIVGLFYPPKPTIGDLFDAR
jgi:hypothetical protein